MPLCVKCIYLFRDSSSLPSHILQLQSSTPPMHPYLAQCTKHCSSTEKHDSPCHKLLPARSAITTPTLTNPPLQITSTPRCTSLLTSAPKHPDHAQTTTLNRIRIQPCDVNHKVPEHPSHRERRGKAATAPHYVISSRSLGLTLSYVLVP